MKRLDLREKDKFMLNKIVEFYLREGRPVSSDLITQKKVLAISPATVRNIMVKLEDLGYLFKPHASAGRVPTDRGLRFYVNSLLEEVMFPAEKKAAFVENVLPQRGDMNSLLSKVSAILAEESDNLGFVLSPRISRIQFNHIRFIKVDDHKVMIILLSAFHLVLNEIVTAPQYFTQYELDEASQYLNLNFRGKSLLFIRDYLRREVPRFKSKSENVLKKIEEFLISVVSQEEQEEHIFLQGTSKLLEKAEMFPREKLKVLFRNFEEKTRLARLISDFIALDRVKVLIGEESEVPDISDCALVLSHYGYKNQVLGSLGIIGPKCIPYKKIIPLVDFIAQGLSRTISKTQ